MTGARCPHVWRLDVWRYDMLREHPRVTYTCVFCRTESEGPEGHSPREKSRCDSGLGSSALEYAETSDRSGGVRSECDEPTNVILDTCYTPTRRPVAPRSVRRSPS